MIATENTFIFISTLRSIRDNHEKILQYFFPQETQCFYNICACYSNLTVRSFSGVSHAIFFPQEVSITMRFVTFYSNFTARNFSGVLHGLLPVISSTLVKKNPNLNVLIRRVNDMLHDLCRMNGFGYKITTVYRWKNEMKFIYRILANILSSNFIKFVNNFLVDNVN